MARIACQVLQRPDRVTFIWSQDNASFEPYHLGPKETEQFYRLADEARQHLASVLAGDNAQLALARAGYELHQLIFRARESDSVEARRIHQWLHDLHEQKSIDSLEIVSDVPGRIPWNLVCEQAPEGTPSLDAFWGVRYPLTTGRRVNPLRLGPIFTEQDVLLVLDPSLPAQQQEAWKESVATAQFANSASELREALAKHCPDLICWVGGLQNGSLVLGEEQIPLAELRRLIDEAKEGNPEPLMFLQVFDVADSPWPAFLEQASTTFPGLMTWESPQAAKLAEPLGWELLGRLLLGGQPLGQILRDLRHKQGWPALGLTAFSPPYVQFGEAEEKDEGGRMKDEMNSSFIPHPSSFLYPLPEEPYKPFASLDREDRPLLAGRDRDIARFAGLLDGPNSRLILLHGGFGVGKSSFLRAGVVPFLEDNSLGFFALRDRTPGEEETPAEESDYPVLTVRASRDLAGQLAEALCAFCAQPYRFETPLKDAVTVPLTDILHAQTNADKEIRRQGDKETRRQGDNADEADVESAVSLSPCLPVSLSAFELWEAFQEDADLLGRLLDALSSKLPHDLVILIEKGEDLITQAHNEEDRARRQKALHMLNRAAELAPRCKVIFSVRTDFLGRVLDDFPPSPFVRQFLLPELGRDQLVEILTLSTANEAIPFTDEVPFEKYNLSYEDGFAEKLVEQVQNAAAESRQSAVILLQTVCARLRHSAQRLVVPKVSEIQLKNTGDVAQAAAATLDDRFELLFPHIQRAGKDMWIGVILFVIALVIGVVSRMVTSLPVWLLSFLFLFVVVLAGLQIYGTFIFFRGLIRLRSKAAKSYFALRSLFDKLYSPEPGGTVACDTLSVEQVKKAWRGPPEGLREAMLGAEKEGLLEMPRLLVAGKEGSHTVLANDSLARVAQDWTDRKKTRKYTRSKIIDVWFLALPLICLAGAATYFFANWRFQDALAANKKAGEDILKVKKAELEEANKLLQPAYLGCIAQADLAWQAADLARVKLFLEKVAPATEKEMRGFEWHYLWRLANSERLAMRGPTDMVVALAVSPDGGILAAAGKATEAKGKAATITLWNLPKGTRRSTIPTTDTVNALAFSGDGKYLAWAGADKAVHVTDLSRDREYRTLSEHTDAVLALAFYQDVVISAGADKKVIVWDLDKDKARYKLEEHAGAVHALALDRQRNRLATGGADGKVIIWDLSKNGPPVKKHVLAPSPGGIVRALAFSPDGKNIVSGGSETSLESNAIVGFMRSFDVETGGPIVASAPVGTPPSPPIPEVISLAYSPDGKTVASAGQDNLIRLWNAAGMREPGVIKGHSNFVSSVVFAGNDNLISGSLDGDVKIWLPTPTARIDVLHSGTDPMTSVVLSPNDKLLAGASKDGKVYVWDLAKSELLKTIENSKLPVTALAFGRAGNTDRLAAAYRSGKDEGTLKVWDLEAGEKGSKTAKEVFTRSFPGKVAVCLAFTSDAKSIVWGGSGGSTELWEVEGNPKEPRTVFAGPKQTVRCLGISGKGRSLVAGSDDEAIYLWEIASGKSLPNSPWKVERGPISSLFVLGEVNVVSGGRDGAVMIWQIGEKEDSGLFTGHLGPVSSIVISPHLEIFTASWDHTIKIWQPSSARQPSKVGLVEQFTLRGHTGPVRSIALTRDGQTLVSASDDGTVRLWRAPRKD